MVQLDQNNDIYTYGFLSFLKDQSARQSDEIVMKCVFTFAFQFILSAMLIGQYRDKQGDLLTGVHVGDVKLNCVRILCSFLLHLSIITELAEAKALFSFVKKHPTNFFNQQFQYPLIFAFMKSCGGIMAVIVNLLIIIRSETIEDVVKDFVAVMIIMQIDDEVARTVSERVEDFVAENEIWMSKETLARSDWDILKEHVWTDAEDVETEESVKGLYR